jgi:uncharacterized RmlC-like cupin family protein
MRQNSIAARKRPRPTGHGYASRPGNDGAFRGRRGARECRFRMSDSISRWRFNGVRIERANELDASTAQTLGMQRRAAITTGRTGATKLWGGTVTIDARAKTGPHHHGGLEGVIYVVNGVARLRWGNRLEFVAEAEAADFIYGRFHLRASLCSTSGDQRQRGSATALRCDAKRADRSGLQPGYRADRAARAGPLDRRSAQIAGVRRCCEFLR